MEYEIIDGKRFNGNKNKVSKLLWVPREKHLYVKKVTRNDKTEFICYQTILTNRKKKVRIDFTILYFKPIFRYFFQSLKNTEGVLKCTARAILHPDGRLIENSITHTPHESHESLYHDILTANEIKNKCHVAKVTFPDSAHKISEKSIFYRELAMWALHDNIVLYLNIEIFHYSFE